MHDQSYRIINHNKRRFKILMTPKLYKANEYNSFSSLTIKLFSLASLQLITEKQMVQEKVISTWTGEVEKESPIPFSSISYLKVRIHDAVFRCHMTHIIRIGTYSR